MNELALFAGAGGGILGGHILGWRTVCAVEIDSYARSVLLARQLDGCLPRFPIWDDIRTFDGNPWRGHVDVISGGFPCQDISCAGKGAGIDGERSGLWSEMFRVVREVGPGFVWVENSPMLTVAAWGESSVTWPRSGMMQNGVCWERTMSVPRTEGKESGFLPTPTVSEAIRRHGYQKSRGVKYPTLTGAVGAAPNQWPTPCATMCKGSSPNALTRRDGRSRDRDRLDHAVMASNGGTLNPTWTEWLMGWPLGWTSMAPMPESTWIAWQGEFPSDSLGSNASAMDRSH